MHALVIEDDPIIAMLIEDELRDIGFRSVDLAATQDEAVDAATRKCPDLVTSDGSLLAGSGTAAARHIRRFCSVPVIFITGEPDEARECLPDAQVVEKPFSIAALHAAVARARPLMQRGQ